MPTQGRCQGWSDHSPLAVTQVVPTIYPEEVLGAAVDKTDPFTCVGAVMTTLQAHYYLGPVGDPKGRHAPTALRPHALPAAARLESLPPPAVRRFCSMEVVGSDLGFGFASVRLGPPRFHV